MKRILIIAGLLVALFSVKNAEGQGTITVTGVATDPSGTAWASGTYSASYVIPPGAGSLTNTATSQTISPTTLSGSLDASGAFSITLVSTANVLPAIKGVTFRICPQMTNSPCYTTVPILIGTTSPQSVSSQIDLVLQNPSVTGAPLAQAYNDAEVTAVLGNMYARLSDSTFRCYTTSWGACGGGGGGSGPIYTNIEFSNGTCTTAKTIDPANGNRQSVTLTAADACALTFTQPVSKTASVQLRVVQSSSGSFNGTISGGIWPGALTPTITQTSGATDFINCYLDGTNTYCSALQNFALQSSGSFVQGNANFTAGSSTTTAISIGTVAAGDLIVTCAGWSGSTTYAVSDGTSSFTTTALQTIVGSPDTVYTRCAYLLSANAGAVTYTTTWGSGVTNREVWVAEFHQTLGSWHLLATSGAVSTPSTPSTASSSGTFSPSNFAQATVMDTKLDDVGSTITSPLIAGSTPTEFSFSPVNTFDHKYYLLNQTIASGTGNVTYGTATYWSNIVMSFGAF